MDGRKLKTTKYRNGDPIPNITDLAWLGLTSGAYGWYNNDITNKAAYGALYNSFAVNDSRKIAPEGWHVPNLNEVETLLTYLGGGIVAGGKLKETGTTHWASPNMGATNESGFTALPGGMGGGTSSQVLEETGNYWISPLIGGYFLITYSTGNDAWIDQMIASTGLSVRCVKD